MKPSEFFLRIDESAIMAAIAEAESKSSGEIRVYVSERKIRDARTRAEARFDKLGMRQSRERNAVLLYFAPRAQQFAVIGDAGIHAVCGQEFWNEVAAEIQRDLRAGHFQPAVIKAVNKVGALLARHFPRRDDDSNELSDSILRD